MTIKKVSIKNFKNLQGDYNLSPCVNLIIGPNGAGKTNMLEAIYLLSTGKSFRNQDERDCIKWDTLVYDAFFRVEAHTDLDQDPRHLQISVGRDPNSQSIKKKFEIDQKPTLKKNFVFRLPSILFLPANIDFVSGSPDTRRDILDDFLVLIDHSLVDTLSEYKKVLKNRNKLLKMIRDSRYDPKQLNFWSEKLIELGSYIVAKRLKTLNLLLPHMTTLAQKIFHEDLHDLNFEYLSKIVESNSQTQQETKQKFEAKIYANLDKEIFAAQCLYGPHRDDIQFGLGKMKVKESASRGQQRIVSIIFKLAFWYYLQKHQNLKPILLFDDVMSELDSTHRKNLENCVQELGVQTVLTSTSLEEFSSDFRDQSNVILFGR